MIRKITGVIAAYAIFVVSALALFKFSGQDAHADPTTGFAIFAAIYGAVFSFLAGFILQLIAATKNIYINLVLAFIIAGFAAFSLFKSEGNHWTQLLAIFVFAPASVLGGYIFLKRK